jgi:hypothetical protein
MKSIRPSRLVSSNENSRRESGPEATTLADACVCSQASGLGCCSLDRVSLGGTAEVLFLTLPLETECALSLLWSRPLLLQKLSSLGWGVVTLTSSLSKGVLYIHIEHSDQRLCLREVVHYSDTAN